MKDEFYIGYMPKAPKRIARFVIAFVVLLFVVMGSVSFFLSTTHDHINNGTYEFGELTTLKGVINMEPVPHLRVLADANGKVGKNIMLINYGKFGAISSIEKMASKIGDDISNVEVTIRGTLIYQDGFTLLELTEKEHALQSYEAIKNPDMYTSLQLVAGSQSFTGEIIDPKCYFGSMKPAQSKPHKSCASLCISGGISPMYVVQTEQQTAEYYILRGLNGEDISSDILDFVAEGTNIEGKVVELNEWNVLYIDPTKIRRLN